MNDMEFMEIIGKIDDDLIREAADEPEQIKVKRSVSGRTVCILGSAAAAAVAVGCVALYNAHRPAIGVSESTVVQSSSSAWGASPAGGTSSARGTSSAGVASPANGETPENERSQPATTGAKEPDSICSLPKYQSQPEVTGKEEQDVYYAPFKFTANIDHDIDGYGEDEAHHVDVRIAGHIYHQLALDEYAAIGLSTPPAADFGEYIGKVVEVDDSNYHGNAAESQEPTIAGAEVYYHEQFGESKAFIIVRKGDQCSIFVSDNIDVSAGFKTGLEFFGVESANYIQSVDYRVNVLDGATFQAADETTITDRATIEALYDLLCELQPEDYTALPDNIGSPQWLVDAWAAYKADPNRPPREDYFITINLKDGTTLQEIQYQPYLGNGYVEHMQQLTPAQNTALSDILR